MPARINLRYLRIAGLGFEPIFRDIMDKKKRKKAGLPPGSLVFTGQKHVPNPNVTLLQFNAGELRLQSSEDQIPEPEAGGFVNWYDIRGLSNVSLIESIGSRYRIHPLVLEDVLNTDQRPKVEDYEDGIFLILNALMWDAEHLQIRKEQVAIFTAENLVISFQEDEDDLFPSVRERLEKASGKIRRRGADFLTYALVDFIIDHYFIVLDYIEAAIEELDAEIRLHSDLSVKTRIHALRLAILKMRKASVPTRDAIGRLYKIDHPVSREETGLFLRDLYDHIIQVNDSIDTYREMINGLYDLHLSEINLRMNNIIKVLTIISTIFIPLTFLVGVYGMNFRYMPELEWKSGYFILWMLMISISIGLIFFFRRKKWL